MRAAEAELGDLLRNRGIVDAAGHAALLATRPGPWWLMLLQGVAAWFASLLIMSAVSLPLAGFGTTALVRGVAGVVLCATAIWLFRFDRLFTNQMALAFSLAGQGLLVWALGDRWDLVLDHDRQLAGVGLLVTGAMLLPRASRLHRVVCGLILIFDAGVLIGSGPGAEVLGVVLAAGVAWSCVTRSRWATHPRGGLLGALTLAAGVAALALPAILRLARGDAWAAAVVGHAGFAGGMAWLAPGAGLVLVALGAYLLRGASQRGRVTGVVVALLWGLVFHAVPGLIVAATVFLAAFQASQRTLAAFALLAAVLYVGEFYYLLDVSLLHKSGLLALGGAVLLAVRGGLRRLNPGDES